MKDIPIINDWHAAKDALEKHIDIIPLTGQQRWKFSLFIQAMEVAFRQALKGKRYATPKDKNKVPREK